MLLHFCPGTKILADNAGDLTCTSHWKIFMLKFSERKGCEQEQLHSSKEISDTYQLAPFQMRIEP